MDTPKTMWNTFLFLRKIKKRFRSSRLKKIAKKVLREKTYYVNSKPYFDSDAVELYALLEYEEQEVERANIIGKQRSNYVYKK